MPELILPHDCLENPLMAKKAGCIISTIMSYPNEEDKGKGDDMLLTLKAAVVNSYKKEALKTYNPTTPQDIKDLKEYCINTIGGALYFDDEDRDNLLFTESITTYTDRLSEQQVNRDINTVCKVFLILIKTYHTPELSGYASLNKSYGFVELEAGKNNKAFLSNKRAIESVWSKYKSVVHLLASLCLTEKNRDSEINLYSPQGLRNFLSTALAFQNFLLTKGNNFGKKQTFLTKDEIWYVPEYLNLTPEEIKVPPLSETEKEIFRKINR